MRCSKSCYLYDLELVELKIVQGCTIFKHYITNQQILKVNLTALIEPPEQAPLKPPQLPR